MDFRTILVDLSEDSARSARIETAARVAAKFGGSVVGLTANGTNLEPFRGAAKKPGNTRRLPPASCTNWLPVTRKPSTR